MVKRITQGEIMLEKLQLVIKVEDIKKDIEKLILYEIMIQ